MQDYTKYPAKASKAVEIRKPVEPPKPKEPKLKRIWDNYREIGKVVTGDRRSVVVGIGIRDGVSHIVLRDFYKVIATGEWHPSFHGLTVPIRIPINKGAEIVESYQQLTELLQQAVDVAATLPLADPKHAVFKKPKGMQ